MKKITSFTAFKSFATALAVLFGMSCAIAQPTITSFSPSSAPIGASINIQGSNFNSVASNNVVYFGGTQASVTSATSTSLDVNVPVGSFYDVISVTDVTTGLTAYSNLRFSTTYTSADTVFKPSSFSAGVPYYNHVQLTITLARCFSDFDGDGKPDLAECFTPNTWNAPLGFLSISRNTSNFNDFSFATAVEYPVSMQYDNMVSLKAVDFDGDGKKDIVYSNSNTVNDLYYLTVYKNTSSPGNISFDTPITVETAPRLTMISIGDLDGDGKPDMAISTYNGDYYFNPSYHTRIFRNTSAGGVISFDSSHVAPPACFTQIKDIDGDGKADLISTNYHTIAIMRSTSTPGNISFAPSVNITISGEMYPLSDAPLDFADMNGDGKLDIVLANSASYISVYLNQSSVGSISFASSVDFPTQTAPAINVADMDGDGKPDIVAIDYTNGTNEHLYIYKNTSSGNTFSLDAPVFYPIVGDVNYVVPLTCDIDCDGKPDILAPNENTSYNLYRNEANEPAIDSLTSGSSSSRMTSRMNNQSTSSSLSTVVVKGDRFLGASDVTFNGVQVNSFTVDSKEQITATVDSAAAATMKIKVTTPLGIASLPVASVSAATTNFCTGSDTSLVRVVFHGDNGFPPYKFRYKINNGIIRTASSGNTDSAVVYKPSTAVAGAFSYNLLNVTDKYGNGANSTLHKSVVVNIITVAPTPGTITGPANVCSYVGTSNPATYSIVAVSGASSYNWTVPANATIISGQGTTSIQVTYTSAFVSGNVAVRSVFPCSSSAYKTKAITKTIPVTPGTITGPMNVCSYVSSATPVTYTIAAISGASSYNWTVPVHATIQSGQGTTAITVLFTSAFVSGAVTVQAMANCGNSPIKSMVVTKTIPAMPGTITGPMNVCSYVSSSTPATYTISAVSGASSYNWTVPANATIQSGQGTTSITVLFSSGFSAGNISVQSVVSCGGSAFKTLAITKTIPAMPGTITGQTNVCSSMASATPVTYSIAPVSGASSYNWIVPANATIQNGQGTTSISILFGTAFISGNVSVQSVVSCGSSAFKTLAVSHTLPALGTITGPSVNVCASTGTYSIPSVVGATSYTWTVPAGVTISSGQGTNTISVSYGSTFVSGNVTVHASDGCSNTATKILTITKTPPAAGAISGQGYHLCGGTTASYSVATVSGATSYTWTVPANASVVSGQGTNTVMVSFTSAFTNGNISVVVSNACASSAPSTFALTAIPPLPGAIAGITSGVCSTTQTYSVTPVNGATSYNWVVAGGTINSGQGTNSISVSFGSAVMTGSVKVQAINACGTTAFKTLSLINCNASSSSRNLADDSLEQNFNVSELYPNPTGGNFSFEIESDHNAELMVETFDISGRMLEGKAEACVVGTTTITENLELFENGVYFVRVTDKSTGNIILKKIVVEK